MIYYTTSLATREIQLQDVYYAAEIVGYGKTSSSTLYLVKFTQSNFFYVKILL